jgi:poly(3-hydroxyoctanoate) depolymerase
MSNGARVIVLASLIAAACSHAPETAAPDAQDDANVEHDAAASSRCSVTAERVTCEHEITKVGVGSDLRDVYWQTPTSRPPPSGYPVVLVYQGTSFGPSKTWDVASDAPFGGYQQGRLQALLLDHGFTVIAPSAAAGFAWQTNGGVPFESTGDYSFINTLTAAIDSGEFDPADPSRMYATGISSGGYMTSRMAVSYGGVFRALAVASASYATCLGAACVVPATLPASHPPTLFLHGTADSIVPIVTMRPYLDRLESQGIATALDEDPAAGHQWLDDSPERITGWFESH